MSKQCTHTDAIRDVEPSALGCGLLTHKVDYHRLS